MLNADRVVQALSVTTYEFFTIIKTKLLRTILGHKYSMGNSTLNICRLRENPECCMIKYYKRAYRWWKTHETGEGSTKLAISLTKNIFAALGPHLITWGISLALRTPVSFILTTSPMLSLSESSLKAKHSLILGLLASSWT